MLGKLCKHEIRATARWFLPLFAITILLSPITRFTYQFLDLPDANRFIQIMSGIILFAFICSILIVMAASILLIVFRFYKNMVTEEGYLMHTLPVTTAQLIWSKLIVAAFWSLASLIVIALALFLMFFTFDGFAEFIQDFRIVINDLFQDPDMKVGYVFEFGIEMIILIAVSILGTPLIFYAAIAIGQLFQGHKVVGAVVGYFGINIIGQIIGAFLIAVVLIPLSDFLDHQPMQVWDVFGHLFLPIIILLTLLTNGILYFITWYIMDKKLNLD